MKVEIQSSGSFISDENLNRRAINNFARSSVHLLQFIEVVSGLTCLFSGRSVYLVVIRN